MKRVLMMLFLTVCLNLGYTLNAATAIGVISLEKVYNGYWRTDVENKKLKSKSIDDFTPHEYSSNQEKVEQCIMAKQT